MEITADDNFFIEEPQKLRNNFFNKDKSIQIVELLAQKHHDSPITDKQNRFPTISRIQPCRLTYYKKLQQLQQAQLREHQNQLQPPAKMPRSIIARLEVLCQAAYSSDDISLAKRAVDSLVSASNSGCCFLERYIVMLMNFCTKNYALATAAAAANDDHDDPLKIKVEELLNRVMIVDFDRQQLAENFRKPEYKLTSIKHVVQLLKRVQDMLDYREQTAINWLLVLLDAYFVELATTDEAVEIIDRISAHISFKCALSREMESSKCLLKTLLEQLDEDSGNENKGNKKLKVFDTRHNWPFYSIDEIKL